MQIDIRHDLNKLSRWASATREQVKRAQVQTINWSAYDARNAVKAEMPRVFDRPTRYTLNSVYVDTANASTLTARVWLKDNYGTHKHYLMPQVFGGARGLKRFEGLLVRAGFMFPNQRAVPADGVQLNGYGNVSPGLIVRILAQLRVATTPNSYDVSNAKSRATKRLAKQGLSYFVLQPSRGITYRDRGGAISTRNQHLPAGIYEKKKTAFGQAVRAVFIFVDGTNYKPRLFFNKIVTDAVNRGLTARFERALRKEQAR
jgi:hypothetical protein